MFVSLLIGAAALASTARAQLDGLDVSSDCQSAALNLVTSNFGTCANLIGLTNILRPQQGSIVQPLNGWISTMCHSDPCSQSTLDSASSTLKDGCQQELDNGNELVTGVDSIISNYDSVRDLSCLQYSSNQTYCVPFLIDNIQNSTDTQFNLTDIIQIIGTSDGLASFYADAPAGAVCNDCGQAVAAQGQELDSSSDSVQNAVSDKCGDDFSSNSMPDSVDNVAVGQDSDDGSGDDDDDDSSALTFHGQALAVLLGAATLMSVTAL